MTTRANTVADSAETVLQQLEALRTERAQKAQADYRAVVQRLARDQHKAGDTAEFIDGVLQGAQRVPEQFQADIEAQKRRIAAHAEWKTMGDRRAKLRAAQVEKTVFETKRTATVKEMEAETQRLDLVVNRASGAVNAAEAALRTFLDLAAPEFAPQLRIASNAYHDAFVKSSNTRSQLRGKEAELEEFRKRIKRLEAEDARAEEIDSLKARIAGLEDETSRLFKELETVNAWMAAAEADLDGALNEALGA